MMERSPAFGFATAGSSAVALAACSRAGLALISTLLPLLPLLGLSLF